MSIPYILLLAAVLSSWTAMLINVHSHVEAWQRTQIAIDNAVTVMGQDDRDLFNVVQKFNKVIDGLVAAHHVAHACALVFYTAAECQPIDNALEKFIPKFNKIAMNIAKLAWQVSRLRGLLEMAKLNTVPIKIERDNEPPIHAEKCIYGFETYIQIDDGKAPVTTLIEAKPNLNIQLIEAREEDGTIQSLTLRAVCEVGGKSLKSSSKWNYRLKTGMKADYAK